MEFNERKFSYNLENKNNLLFSQENVIHFVCTSNKSLLSNKST